MLCRYCHQYFIYISNWFASVLSNYPLLCEMLLTFGGLLSFLLKTYTCTPFGKLADRALSCVATLPCEIYGTFYRNSQEIKRPDFSVPYMQKFCTRICSQEKSQCCCCNLPKLPKKIEAIDFEQKRRRKKIQIYL